VEAAYLATTLLYAVDDAHGGHVVYAGVNTNFVEED